MASIINKLLGKDNDHEHSHGHKTETKCQDGTCTTTITGGEKCGTKQECKSGATVETCKTGPNSGTCKTGAHGETCESRSVQRDGVNIKSTISTEGSSSVSLASQQQLVDLVTRLGSTHSQIDDYAKKQTEAINEQIQREIDEVVGRTRREQEELVRKANEHTAEIDQEYRARLQLMVEEIDAAKAKRISEIEVDLNNQQAGILQSARNDIDALNKKASRLKIGVLEAAEAKVANDARNIAATTKIDNSAAVHHATETTTIKTEVSAAATTTAATSGSAATARDAHNTAGGARVTETKTIETTKRQ